MPRRASTRFRWGALAAAIVVPPSAFTRVDLSRVDLSPVDRVRLTAPSGSGDGTVADVSAR